MAWMTNLYIRTNRASNVLYCEILNKNNYLKLDWNQILLKWMHTKGDSIVGKFVKEDAKEGFFFRGELHKCRDQKHEWPIGRSFDFDPPPHLTSVDSRY